MAGKFFFSLDSIKPKKANSSGSLTLVTSKDVPGFVNIAFSQLNLNQRGSLEPIWHPNANKIGFCTEGNHLVTIRTPTSAEVFTLKKGEMFFIPKGYIYHIENIGDRTGVINFAYDNANPDTMVLSKAIYSLSDSVFNDTFGTNSTFADGLKKSKSDECIKTLPPLKQIPKPTTNRFKFDIEASNKAILTKGGYLQIGTKTTLPLLNGLGILGFGLNNPGVVEPHWHTNAGELVYIVKGKTKITVLSPDGSLDVMEVKAGEGAFAPASYFHNIENIGSENVEVIAFFNHEQPDYIGIGEVLGSYPNELLSSVFDTSPSYFDSFKKPKEPLVIVPI
ncbi:cupin domain-containing protein [Criblamydia sequanensis]|uniref:Cupin domain-containing protein n=1 Tax=Candidatus Criblamydia sequanensis CRIB-18 TaxID=1437425 RepID=A0A090D3E5_9BACT|nr:cupin domain-containing protein [Criblamydia sequanensis]CDR35243.1 Cupin domain-containing protein [Criblamydia sequanensis CRIB-18]